MYKLVLKDKTEINLKSIEEDTEKCMTIALDTVLSHDEVISHFTKDNLSYVQILYNAAVLNTYVNFKEVSESSVKEGIITVKISKSDTKEIIITLRKENEDFKIANEKLSNDIRLNNKSIDELRDIVIALSMSN